MRLSASPGILDGMKTKLSLPLFLFLLAALGLAFVLPTGNGATAVASADPGVDAAPRPDKGEKKGDEGEAEEEEEDGDFFDEETSFSMEQVEKAILKGVAWLKKKQQGDGSWGEIKGTGAYGGGKNTGPGYPSGSTALALYALLKCKEKLNDPVIKKGFAYLEKGRFSRQPNSYEIAMTLLAVTATANQNKTRRASRKAAKKAKLKGKYKKWADELKKELIKRRHERVWRYNTTDSKAGPSGEEDLSSTQIVSLALFEAHQLGVKVRPKVWEGILSYSLEQQEDDGPEVKYKDPVDPTQDRVAKARGFSYIKGDSEHKHAGASGAMTACGIANIEMARFILSKGGSKAGKASWNKRPEAAKVQTALYDGIAWIEKNWSSFANPPGKPWDYHLYWMYSIERAMDLLSLRRVGSHSWYNEMGQELINRQQKEGQWNTQSTHTPHDVLDTCFALLFLKRSTKNTIPFGSITGGSDEPPIDNR